MTTQDLSLASTLLQVETSSMTNFIFTLIEHGYHSLRNLTAQSQGSRIMTLTKLWMNLSPTQLMVLKVTWLHFIFLEL